jgi:putative Ca2+/H+ antiporter (TMEM165/GDT1 family)
MEALLLSATVVAVGEIGDKTQLLALMLACRFRRPWTIVAGIFVATLANHALAGYVGHAVRDLVPAEVLRWALGGSFVAMALWALKPDQLDDAEPKLGHAGVFVVTLVAFFLAEMGDKTQIATVMLAAKFPALGAVVVGTTIGMLAANVPVAFAGRALSRRVPFKAIRIAAAAIFSALGLWVLVAGIPA